VAGSSPAQLAGTVLGGVLHVSQAAVDLPAGAGAAAARLAVDTARAGSRVVSAAAITTGTMLAVSTRISYGAAIGGVRSAGRVLTGSDRIADGDLPRLAEVAKAMFEPAHARRTRRVWTTRGRAHVELAAGILHAPAEVRRKLLYDIERLGGVEWAAVNDVVGRVVVAFDPERISVDKVVCAVAAFEQARGVEQIFAPRDEHPADLEPLVAAGVAFVIDVAAVGLAFAGKVLPVPALTRHATAVLPLLDTVPGVRRALSARFGTIGADLVFTGVGALLHTAAQNPTVPALYGVAAAARVLEVSSRRAVWQRREPQLCHPVSEDTVTEWPAARPMPLPPGPVEAYRAQLRRWSAGGALGVLAFTARPTRSADWVKAVSPMAAVLGREVFAAVLDHLMCRRGVLPIDGSAYRRLDRIDAVVLDSDVLCSGPPVVVAATAHADGWDSSRVRGAAAQLLGLTDAQDWAAFDGDPTRLRLTPPEESPGAPEGRVRQLFDGEDVVGTVTIADRFDPLAETLLAAGAAAGLRLVLTQHPGVAGLAGIVDEIAAADEPLGDTVRRLQADGHGVLAVSVADGTGLIAADVGVAVPDPERPPAWGADLVTQSGLGDVWRLMAATTRARAMSERAVGTALVGNVLGGLLAAFGGPLSGQRAATTPGKVATAFTMAMGIWSALQLDAEPVSPGTAGGSAGVRRVLQD
jgi:cation-transporting ATPase I